MPTHIREGESAADTYFNAAQDIGDIELALDICNNMSGFVSAELQRIRSKGGSQSREAELNAIRLRFLREEKAKLGRDNMAYVRQFIAEYAPQVKRCFTTGELPDIFKG
jgi:hypothetical protein